MVKSGRPVIVLSQSLKHRTGLVTVVALSTIAPDPVCNYHCQIPRNCLPQLGMFDRNENWVKGDMIYTVGFHRLDLIMLGKRDPQTGKRLYFADKLGRERMKEIYGCVLHGLNMGKLVEYLE